MPTDIAATGAAISIFAMVIALLGAWIAAKGVFISPERASELSETYWDENLALRDALLSQSRLARNGLIAVAVGTGFQIAGTILPLIRLAA